MRGTQDTGHSKTHCFIDPLLWIVENQSSTVTPDCPECLHWFMFQVPIVFGTGGVKYEVLILTGLIMLIGGSHNVLLCVVFVPLLLINGMETLSFFPCNLDTTDRMFFPDQVNYLRVWTSRCACADRIYWPPNDMCYEELTQGPCSVGRVLVFDRKKIEPRCENGY
jgi:hypothetical protein